MSNPTADNIRHELRQAEQTRAKLTGIAIEAENRRRGLLAELGDLPDLQAALLDIRVDQAAGTLDAKQAAEQEAKALATHPAAGKRMAQLKIEIDEQSALLATIAARQHRLDVAIPDLQDRLKEALAESIRADMEQTAKNLAEAVNAMVPIYVKLNALDQTRYSLVRHHIGFDGTLDSLAGFALDSLDSIRAENSGKLFSALCHEDKVSDQANEIIRKLKTQFPEAYPA